MSDFYTEQLVKRKTPMSSILLGVLLVLVTIASVRLIFMFPFAIIVPVVLIAVDVFVFKCMNVEYEYLYVNGSLDIDKIMSKSRRKKIMEMEIADLEVMAPKGAAELRQYQSVKAKNYSSRTSDDNVYEMVISRRGVKERIIFEPNDVIVDGMKMLAPRKVFVK